MLAQGVVQKKFCQRIWILQPKITLKRYIARPSWIRLIGVQHVTPKVQYWPREWWNSLFPQQIWILRPTFTRQNKKGFRSELLTRGEISEEQNDFCKPPLGRPWQKFWAHTPWRASPCCTLHTKKNSDEYLYCSFL